MKILKNAGTFEIVKISTDIVEDIAKAGRVCKQSTGDNKNNIKLVRNLLDMGHHAMVEFSDMTVKFDLISRGFTHEQVRHRLTNIAQESTRFVDESEFLVVVPPHKNEDEKVIEIKLPFYECKISLKEWFELNEQAYRSLRKAGWKPEDARQVLPIAIKSQLMVKANLREWIHIFKMRCDVYAHWEIRGVMLQLLNTCKKNVPLIFDDFRFYSKIDTEFFKEYFDKLEPKYIVDNQIYARNY